MAGETTAFSALGASSATGLNYRRTDTTRAAISRSRTDIRNITDGWPPRSSEPIFNQLRAETAAKIAATFNGLAKEFLRIADSGRFH